MAYKFFDKKSTGNGVNFVSNQQHANELYNLKEEELIHHLKKHFGCRFNWYVIKRQIQ